MLDLSLFLPELVLLVGGIVVLVVDAVLRDRGKGEARLGWLSLAILAIALVVSLTQVGTSIGLFRVTPALTSPGMYAVDGFTTFFRITSILTTGLIILMSMDYIRNRTAFRGEFFALMLFSTLAMILMAGSTDLVMVILSLEFLSITSYVLTGYLRGNVKSNEGAVKYFLFGSVTTAVTFYGASLLFGVTGSTNLYDIARALPNPPTVTGSATGLILPAIIFLVAGFAFKIALVPFHQWSPDAYEGAPTPVTAFLSVGPKAAGLAMLLRVMVIGMPTFVQSWAAVLLGIAIVTMTLGNMAALSQSNVKRLMAYSSIAQAGYMVIGVVAISLVDIAAASGGPVVQNMAASGTLAQTTGIGSTIDGTAGVLLYILAYLFTNIGLFTGIVAVDHLAGSDQIHGYAGLIKRAPFLTVAMTIFFLSLVGIPPTAGFIGKFWVFGAALNKQLIFLALVGAVNGVISVVYYFRMLKAMWLTPPVDATPLRLPGGMMTVLVLCLVMVLLIGLYPSPFIQFANQSIQMFGFGGGVAQALR